MSSPATVSLDYAKGLGGVIATESALSRVDGAAGKLYYRGIPIEELAGQSTFEEVSFFLLTGRLPTREELDAFSAELAEARPIPRDIRDVIRTFPADAHPMAALRTAVSALHLYDREAEDNSPEANHRKAIRLIATMPTIAAAIERSRRGQPILEPRADLSHAANFLYMLNGTESDPTAERVMDLALVLHADHGMNASTFTCVVVISSLSDIYSAIVAGIGSLKGPLHGGANEAVMKTLLEIGSVEKVDPWVEQAFAEKRKIMGFGHRVYKAHDPRATVLSRYSEQLADVHGNRLWYEMSRRMEELVTSRTGEKGIWANVGFYSATVYYYLGFEPDLYPVIFAVARVSGWTAHVIEQLSDNRIFRSRAKYVGPLEAHYVPMAER